MSAPIELNAATVRILTSKAAGFSYERTRLLLEFVRHSGAMETLETWEAQDRVAQGKRAGGRPRQVSFIALCAILLGLVLEGHAPTMTNVAEHIADGMDTKTRDLLGLPSTPASTSAWTHRATRTFHALLRPINPSPFGPARRTRLSPDEFRQTRDNADPHHVEHRDNRLTLVMNLLVRTVFAALPADLKNRHAGDTAVDATFVKTFGQRGHDRQRLRHIGMDPDAGWWTRHGDHNGDQVQERKRAGFGYDLHIATSTWRDPDEADFPIIALAVGYGVPGRNPAGITTAMYRFLHDAGHPAGRLVGDLLYWAGQDEDTFHKPLVNMGYRPVTDYRVDQLEVTGEIEGALVIEGSLYCPQMQHDAPGLVTATRRFLAGEIDFDQWQRLLEQRSYYLFKPKGLPDEDGYQRFTHPTDGGTHICDSGRKHAPKACRQKSFTVPANSDLKKRQPLRHGTQEWLAAYGHGRNAIETFNAYIKDATTIGLGEQSRRRVRGIAAQFFYSTLHVVAGNLRKVRAFFLEQEKRAEALRSAGTKKHRRSRREEPKAVRLPFGKKRRARTPQKIASELAALASHDAEPTLSAVIRQSQDE